MGSKVAGIFDSGVGGLSILRAVHSLMPGQPLIYFADQAHVPYGSRSLDEVRKYSENITNFLIEQGAGVIVVACNTASAAALYTLREKFPGTSFVGMEPAVKPAVEKTQSGVVGVLATPATFQGELFASVMERFSAGVTVLKHTCPGLVARIENGDLDTPQTRAILEQALQPMIAQGVDSIVLGCTHYPFVLPLIRKIAGENVQVIDPSMAVARQVKRVLEAAGLLAEAKKRGRSRFITSGEAGRFKESLSILLGIDRKVEQAEWMGDTIRSESNP